LLSEHSDVDVNEKDEGWTALTFATSMSNGNPEAIKAMELLLQHDKIDPNIKNESGHTPSCIAASHRNYEALSILLAHDKIASDAVSLYKLLDRAIDKNELDDLEKVFVNLNCKKIDINVVNHETGYTLLHLASARGCKSLVKTLINKGADVGAVDHRNSNTALHFAATCPLGGFLSNVETLVKAGADPVAKNAANRTPKQRLDFNYNDDRGYPSGKKEETMQVKRALEDGENKLDFYARLFSNPSANINTQSNTPANVSNTTRSTSPNLSNSRSGG